MTKSVGGVGRFGRLRSAAGSINSGRLILESRCAERCAKDAFLTSFRATLKRILKLAFCQGQRWRDYPLFYISTFLWNNLPAFPFRSPCISFPLFRNLVRKYLRHPVGEACRGFSNNNTKKQQRNKQTFCLVHLSHTTVNIFTSVKTYLGTFLGTGMKIKRN